RGFRPDPVPESTIREVLDIARLAPSSSNTQPWHIAVVSGEARRRLESAIFQEIEAGKAPYPGFPPGGAGLQGDYKRRQYECAFGYYGTMGIARDDLAARRELLLKNWQFFGAPHAAFLSMPGTMNRANALDVGIFMQSIMLLFAERGIGCCPQGALASYPDPVRAVARIPEGNTILCGLSFGYEEPGARINQVRMAREPLDTVASFAS
ncbi:MAG TPA: nitroreductase, partial [Burkholderiaceae bacterium]|nr:nitroreductase [Burkholderiaceae bacterium]